MGVVSTPIKMDRKNLTEIFTTTGDLLSKAGREGL
jgi:hypothetical protein